MIEPKTRWDLSDWTEQDEQLAQVLCRAVEVPPLIARLLVQRGYREEASAQAFLYGGEGELHDPFLLYHMREAVDRIRLAGEQGQKIRIYGDYDADGVSSTSLLIQLFRSLDWVFDYYIPHREREGYGLNRQAIQLAANEGVRLIVTVDTGISAYDEVAFANELGIDVVVTDHHEPPAHLPEAVAVVNPKQLHCSYPFKGLAGVGVAFKLATALLNRVPLEWSDIVSLGTIADLMPLTGENRVLVRYGLERIRNQAGIGFRALAESCGIELESVQASTVAFGMAPRINAAGRLDHASRAVELLTSTDYDEAILNAIGLDNLNKERQRIVEEIVNEAEEQWAQNCETAKLQHQEPPAVIIAAHPNWHVGVIGIVASKLLERHYRPVIIFGIDEATGVCKGSARSIEGYDLHAALTSNEALLMHYGGHHAAAGMSMRVENLKLLEAGMSKLAIEWLSAEQWIAKTRIDMACSIEDASLETIAQLELLEPFGMGNPAPRLLFNKVELTDRRAIGKEGKHLKLAVSNPRKQLEAIGFGIGELAKQLTLGSKIDVVGELSINEWNNFRKPQLLVKDLQVKTDPWSRFPTREQFGQVYQYIRKQQSVNISELQASMAKLFGLTLEEGQLMLNVFEELQFITRRSGLIQAITSPQKRELASSKYYQEAQEQYERLNVLA